MERLAVLDGTKNGESGITLIGSTGKGLLGSQFTKTDWTTLIRVKKRQIEALSELQKRGLMSETRASERGCICVSFRLFSLTYLCL